MSTNELSALQSASKRLYVGNLPYQALSNDVEAVFVEAGFQMSVLEA
jgi:RNA recognition motif-containing protein